jgi:AcrR family transcriptional regulator
MATKSTPRKPRADAEHNRERLIEAAIGAFADAEEQDVTLKAIAHRAGVGIGTLYRHFPTREALVEAAYRDELARLQDSADALLERQPPEVAMRSWMDRFADYVAAKRGMADTLRAVVAAGAIASSDTREGLTAAIQRLLDAGVRSGTLRRDVAADDVFASLAGIFLATSEPGDRARASRMLDLLMEGIRRH